MYSQVPAHKSLFIQNNDFCTLVITGLKCGNGHVIEHLHLNKHINFDLPSLTPSMRRIFMFIKAVNTKSHP